MNFHIGSDVYEDGLCKEVVLVALDGCCLELGFCGGHNKAVIHVSSAVRTFLQKNNGVLVSK